MKDTQKLSSYSVKDALKIARIVSGSNYSEKLETVLRIALTDNRNLPVLRFKDSVIPLESYIPKWVGAYLKGYNNRPSHRTGNPSKTFPDTIVQEILKAKLPTLNEDLADKIEGGHSLSMTIENILGDLLEEYLCEKLTDYGWCCCWGSTIDAVDFCKADGSLLQVKTSSNSENSSSSRVRNGTTIEVWHRRVATKKDTYKWDKLNVLINKQILSEDDFRVFVLNVIRSNPNCIYVNPNNPLIAEQQGMLSF